MSPWLGRCRELLLALAGGGTDLAPGAARQGFPRASRHQPGQARSSLCCSPRITLGSRVAGCCLLRVANKQRGAEKWFGIAQGSLAPHCREQLGRDSHLTCLLRAPGETRTQLTKAPGPGWHVVQHPYGAPPADEQVLGAPSCEGRHRWRGGPGGRLWPVLPRPSGTWVLVAMVLALAVGRGPGLLPSGAERTAGKLCPARALSRAVPGRTKPS